MSYPGINNPVAFIGQFVLGSVAGAPLAVDANGLLVSGLTTFQATATASTTTTATLASPAVMGTMTVTPAAGTWLVFFGTSLDHSAQVTEIQISLAIAGTQDATTIRRAETTTNAIGAQSLFHTTMTFGLLTVNGSQAIEGRWGTAGGTATAYQRAIIGLRII